MSRTHSPSSGRPYGLARVCGSGAQRAPPSTPSFLLSARTAAASGPGWVDAGCRAGRGDPRGLQILAGYDLSPMAFLFWVNIILLVLGCLLEGSTIILVILPIFIPTAKALGIDLVHFGVVAVFNIMIGLITPPYGLLLFIISAISALRSATSSSRARQLGENGGGPRSRKPPPPSPGPSGCWDTHTVWGTSQAPCRGGWRSSSSGRIIDLA